MNPWHDPDGRTVMVRCGGTRNFSYTKGMRIEGTHQDVTKTLHYDEEERERERQQRENEIARIAAETSNRAKTEFLFNMSHDIRTPMNAIIGFTDQALRNSANPGAVQESLEKVRSSSEYLLQIVNDVLDMARIESGRLEIKEELRKAGTGANTLVEVMASEADRKGSLSIPMSFSMNSASTYKTTKKRPEYFCTPGVFLLIMRLSL